MPHEIIDPDTGLPVLEKQPNENRVYRMYFTEALPGTTVSSVSSTAQESQSLVPGSSAVSIGSPSIGDDYVDLSISGGTAGENYKITVRIVDSGGNSIEGDGMLYVRNY